jgi:predicted GIY-YIG superfamily endonuclease
MCRQRACRRRTRTRTRKGSLTACTRTPHEHADPIRVGSNAYNSDSPYVCYLLRSHHPSARLNGRLYIGYTEHLQARMDEHKSGRGGKCTKGKGPWAQIATVKGFQTGMAATTFEWMWQGKQSAGAWLKTFADIRQANGLEKKILAARHLMEHPSFAHQPLQLHVHQDIHML